MTFPYSWGIPEELYGKTQQTLLIMVKEKNPKFLWAWTFIRGC